MTSGQWDLNALEALEREALGTFEVLEIPEKILCPKAAVVAAAAAAAAASATAQHHNHHSHQHHHSHQPHITNKPMSEMAELELQDHIKHCSCSCNHMGYGNFMDYQVSEVSQSK